jgi:DNA-binding FadR family transcriptional regulator
LLELREIVEVGSTQLAMNKATDQELVAIEKACDDFVNMVKTEPDNIEGVLKADIAFHNAICHSAHNPVIERIYTAVNKVSYPSRMKAVANIIANKDIQFLIDSHVQTKDMIMQKDYSRMTSLIAQSFKYWSIVLSEK